MKALTLILLSLAVGWSSAYLIKVPTLPTQARIAPVGWVHIQKLMVPLFENVCEDSTNTIIVQLAKEFTLDTSNGDYTKTDGVEYLRSLKTSKGFLQKGEIFTEYNKDHVSELKAVFELLYYAKDFDTFYRAAAWARQNINCGLFVDAIYLAIVNRRDTEKVSVPAPYELMPNYFINRDVVVKASFLLTGDEITSADDVKIEGNDYILDAKYTAQPDDSDEDAKLAYFREDIGLNAYYFIRKLRNSPWLSTLPDTNNLYGERMFQMMKQFAARYDLERYSNELPELEGFTWDSAVSSYDPMLIYSNGNEFDYRSFSGVFNDNDDVTFLKTIENNLASVVTHLRQAGHNKSQILNHLIELLVTSDRSYETVSRKLLGYDTNENKRQCSVLEHYMTTMRDPVFWRINKKIVQLINNSLKVLPTYTRNELYFPGVEVLNVEIKKMMTSFDNFQFDVTDSLKTSTANITFQVKVAQPRLNHKPFVIKLNISSLVTKKGFVKIYLGPKMMPGELALKKHLFVLLDMFELSLKRGANVVSRSSEQMTSFSDDFMSLRTLKKKVEDAEFGLDALPLKTVESQIGYPLRLILPKGLSSGLPLQMFVFVAPFTKSTIGGSNSMANMELNTAIMSPGYPLDLSIETRQLFGLPNAFVKDIVITHKSESKPNGGYGGRPSPNRPYDNSQTDFNVNRDKNNEIPQGEVLDEYYYDDSLLVHGLLGDRPDFTYRKTNNNDYSAKRNQYKTNSDYASKRTDYRKEDYSNKNTDKQSELSFKMNESDTNKEYKQNNEQPDYKIGTNDYTAFNSFERQKKTDVLPVHGLLGERPTFTYKNKDVNANQNEFRNEDYSDKRAEYKNVDFQGRTDKIKTNDESKISSIKDPQNIHSQIINDQNNKRVFQNDLHNDDAMTGDFVYDNKLPMHGLLGKSTEDHTVMKNRYQIKKDNYVQKAETKRIDYRKKAFEKKAKVGILDYTLLENPEDPNYVNEDTATDIEDKNLKKESVGDNFFKELKNKSVFKNTVGDTIEKENALSKDMIKSVEVVTVPYKAKDFPEIVKSSEYLNTYVSKTFNNDINKTKNGSSVPQTTKNKYFSKIITDDSEQIDVYDKDRFSKVINTDIIKNKSVSKIPDNVKYVRDNFKDTKLNEKDGFAKTNNKDITKNKNLNTASEQKFLSTQGNDYSKETYSTNTYDNVPMASTERTKKRVSVYDFILNPTNYEDYDLRVYE